MCGGYEGKGDEGGEGLGVVWGVLGKEVYGVIGGLLWRWYEGSG